MPDLVLNMRIMQAVESAGDRFWFRVFELLSPDGHSPGYFPPESEHALQKAMVDAVRLWAKLNVEEIII